jgi:hypothetical protein
MKKNIIPFKPNRSEFTDEELAMIKRYGEALGGKPTAFDEEVERYLAQYEACYKRTRDTKQRKMVSAFDALAGLENDVTFLERLQVEAEAGLAQELREVEQRVEELRRASQQKAAEASHTRFDPQVGARPRLQTRRLQEPPGMI